MKGVHRVFTMKTLCEISMKSSFLKENKKWICLMTLIMMLQLVVASYFCIQKQGMHYDEYYSYYSSNVTYGLAPTNREWKNVDEIRSEFMVREGEGFRYGLVKTMQSFDVHPPLYYMVLHTVCSFFPGVFSKWFGLGLNLVLFAICYALIGYLSYHVFHKKKEIAMVTCLLFGLQVGVLSGITFIRMYMMLTMWCLLAIIWHIPTWKDKMKLTVKNAFFLWALVTLGFLTHYYFVVFLFFLAAYTCLYNWLVRKDFKGSVLYGIIVCLGMGTAVIYYPSCLSHIFRGYRGTEATGAFFDLGNTVFRIRFFTDLMNQSVFGGALWILLIIVLVLYVTVRYQSKNRKKLLAVVQEHQGIAHIAFVTAGYFLVVAKTALLNAEEANRYELPIYGFCMMLMVAAVYYLLQELKTCLEAKHSEEERQQSGSKAKTLISFIAGLCFGLVLTAQVLALTQGKVQFLYQDDAVNVAWAKEHKDSAVVFLYNPNNTWMIWDESEELMQYDKIYFASLTEETPLQDKELQLADEIYVYTSRMDQAEMLMNDLIESNPKLENKEMIRELLYFDLYRLSSD